MTLMATRASPLAPDHVKALNMIDIEFYGKEKKYKDVIEAWKAYLDQLNTTTTSGEVWFTRAEDLRVELLQRMAISLGYEFDKTAIRRTSYFPKGYGQIELEVQKIREGLVKVLEHESALPVLTIPFSQPGEATLPLETAPKKPETDRGPSGAST